jgi:hypothetical protein
MKSLAWYDTRGRVLGRWAGTQTEGCVGAALPAGLYWIRAGAENRVAVFPLIL